MKPSKKKTKLQLAQEEAQLSINKANDKINELGISANNLNRTLNNIQSQFDKIRNVPSEQMIQFEQAQEIRLKWCQQAEKIEKDYKNACEKEIGGGAAGAGIGVAVVALGPTAAMGIATTFGVASTGTAISSLSGAAATNAALAWLGGGALAAGGGGMAAGQALLALAGPIGWSIAGVALLTSGLLFFKNKQDQKRLVNLFTLISKRDIKKYNLAVVELNERISRIIYENELLKDAIGKIESFGLDYSQMTESQQYELGSYVNLVLSSTKLLTNPIVGLQPNYTEQDFDRFLSFMYMEGYPEEYKRDKSVIVFVANLIHQIKMEDTDIKLLGKSMKSNKDLLKALQTTKKDFNSDYVKIACDALQFKYT